MAVDPNWWGYIVYFGAVGACACVAVAAERRDRTDGVLARSGVRTAAKVPAALGVFWAAYAAALLAADVVVQERFSLAQALDAREFALHTRRGVTCVCAYVAACALFAPPLLLLLEPRGEGAAVADLALTASVLHFVAVAAVTGAFPAAGGWWLAHGLGLALLAGVALALNHRLNLLSAPSTRALAEKLGARNAIEMTSL